MEATAVAPYGYMLGNQKLLHLVRHAHPVHDLEENRHGPLISILFIDAELSLLGWQQVRDLRKNVSASGLFNIVEVVFASPMLRALQTAVGIFGGEEQPDHVTPLKEANVVENDDHRGTGISTSFRPPILASELCRKRMKKGRIRGTISQCRSRFPEVDFSLIKSEEDILWDSDEPETDEAVAARGIKFIKWSLARKEKGIAVVGHGTFLLQTLIALGNNCHPSVEGDP